MPSLASKTVQNPYVGARTFEPEESDLFFGREREAFDLLSLVISDRLVLFYAQSGAGKSSLINTRLIPGLLQEGDFQIFPVGRLRRDEVTGGTAGNIYVYNLLTSLSKQEANESVLAELSLSDYLEHVKFNEERGYFYDQQSRGNIFTADDSETCKYVLIIDQFEELFTTYEERWRDRNDFFEQLSSAMKRFPRLWIVLVMREDYIAYMDPYMYLLPGRLRTRYYMQRLSTERAIEAVEGPAKMRGRIYAEGAATALVKALSQVNVRGQDNEWELRDGQYVEPVQLQVVCSSLWEKLNPNEPEISINTVADHVKNINQALGDFYRDCVKKVAATKDVREREIRQWFEKQLIIGGKSRNMLAQQPDGKSGGLDYTVVREFLGTLVREENRGGAIFYELTHDRMVEPIIKNNQKWFEDNLSSVQQQAAVWHEKGKNPSWLFTGPALVEADKWAKQNPKELTDIEKEFIQACHNQQDKFTARRAIGITIGAVVLMLIAFAAAVFALSQSIKATSEKTKADRSAATAVSAQATSLSNEGRAVAAQATAEKSNENAQVASKLAVERADQALAGNLTAQAESLRNSDYPVALLLGVEAYLRNNSLLTRSMLFQLLQFTPYHRQFNFAGTITSVAASPDGAVIAAASCGANDPATQNMQKCQKGDIFIYQPEDIGDVHAHPVELNGPGFDFGIVYSLSFHKSGDKLWLAAAGCVPKSTKQQGCADKKGQITIWDATDVHNPQLLSDTNSPRATATLPEHTGLVKTIAFSPDGKLVASGSYDQSVIIWKISDRGVLQPQRKLLGHASFVNSLAFSPDGNLVVSAGDDKKILVWDLSQLDKHPVPILQSNAPVTSIAFYPSTNYVSGMPVKFAAASNDSKVRIWAWAHDRVQGGPIVLSGHTGYVTSIAFNADGTKLASAGFDDSIVMWDTETGSQIGPKLAIHSSVVNSIAFGSEGQETYLISGSDDRTLIKWDLSARHPISRSLQRTSASFSQQQAQNNGNTYQAVASGQQVEVKSLPKEDSFLIITGFDAQVRSVEFDAKNTDTLLTMDQNQQSTSAGWLTEWQIDPEYWMNSLACEAIRDSNLTDKQKQLFSSLLSNEPSRAKTICNLAW